MRIDWQADSGGWYDALAYTEPCVLSILRLPDLEYEVGETGEHVVEEMWRWEAVDPNVKRGEDGYPIRWESDIAESLAAAKSEAARVARRWFGERRQMRLTPMRICEVSPRDMAYPCGNCIGCNGG